MMQMAMAASMGQDGADGANADVRVEVREAQPRSGPGNGGVPSMAAGGDNAMPVDEDEEMARAIAASMGVSAERSSIEQIQARNNLYEE